MMGKPRLMQEALFYGFSLERHVPDTRSATPQFERAYGLAISPRLAGPVGQITAATPAVGRGKRL
jgi:hypothetical protein